ncbi:MAG TPA: ROK family protein [Candidatus Paceibacterota bacterium]|nr:ROK family protein [Candidatus Paceibacterota bacterium]
MADTYIVFDIGGTNMRIAWATQEELGAIKKVPTPHDIVDVVTTLSGIAQELSGGALIAAAAGCVPGTVTAGVISDARNRQHWEGINIEKEISSALGVPTTVVNDAGAVGLGEALSGAGKGYRIVAYLTVSTGVGGARIVDGVIDQAGGVGWTPVGDSDLESTISGTAVTKKFGIHPKELDSLEERTKLADVLAEGLKKIYAKWHPDVFVIGGSMIIGVNPIPLDRVRELFTAVPVQIAELGDNGGLVGAAILASRVDA